MTKPAAIKSIDTLYQKRESLLKELKKNNFEEGIHRLLSDMYPDQAHFIYELLQNAEDAEASTVEFHLTKNFLKITHDGKKLFNYNDVDSITSIGDSTKKNDINQIGKFGVGFKAVFAYTSTPKIYSGPFNFEIRDLFCPVKIDLIEKDKDKTIFILPFNTAKKNPTTCFEEISSLFKTIKNSTLLFLNHIEAIEWEIDGHGNGIMLREPKSNIHPSLILISSNDPKNRNRQNDSWYLRFQKKMSQYDKLSYGVAFKLSFRKSAQKLYKENMTLSEQMKIIPETGSLCIFFPAEKETTGLKFHINGPFASTVDRASINHNDNDNIFIFKKAIKLFVNSIDIIKKLKLIDYSFLSVLPINDDELIDFYNTGKEILYESLRTKKIIPTKNNEYSKAEELVRGPKGLSDFFSDKDLSFLSQKQGSKWALNLKRNDRPDKLLTSIGIPNWKNSNFFNDVSDRFRFKQYGYEFDNEDEISINPEDWLKSKEISWLRQFYLLLWSAAKKEDKEYMLSYLPIILTEKKELRSGDEVYFPPTENNVDLGLNIVNKKLLEEKDKAKKAQLIDFLIKSGVNEISETEEIGFILDSFYRKDSPNPPIKQHENHIIKFISYFSQVNDYYIFQSAYIFLDNEKKNFNTSEGCYLDLPFSETGLRHLSEFLKRKPLWHKYSEIDGFEIFAKACGVTHTLGIKKTRINENHPEKEALHEHYWQRWTDYKVDSDYTLEIGEEFLKNPTIETSKLIWDLMGSLESEKLRARFRPNKSYPEKIAPSSLIYNLRQYAWIPDQNGDFHEPKKISKAAIHKDYIYNNNNSWLTDIHLGEDEEKATKEYKEKEQKAIDLGISLEDAKLIKKYSKDFQKWKEQQRMKIKENIFPSKQSKNPKRRKSKLNLRLKNSAKKAYEKKERTVRTTRSNINPREYLLDMYTNKDGDMFCQICQRTLSEVSFKKRNGDYYFDKVEILNKTLLFSEDEVQYIALCPICSSKFREFYKKAEYASSELKKSLLNTVKAISDNYLIPLAFGDENAKLRFVEMHYSDLLQSLKYNDTD